MDKLKNIVKTIIQWIYISIVAFVLGVAMLYLGMYLYTTYSVVGHNDFKHVVNKLLPQSITFADVSINYYGLEPVLKFKNVVVFDADRTTELFQTDELRVGVDWLQSLLHWRIKPNLFLVQGGKVIGYQDEFGQVNSSGSSLLSFVLRGSVSKKNRNLNQSFFEQSKIYFDDINIEWRKKNGEIIQFNNVSLRLYNDIIQHKLTFVGGLVQKGKGDALFRADLNFHGDILQLANFPLVGTIRIENWFPRIDFAEFGQKNKFFPYMGDVDLIVKNSQITTNILRYPLRADHIFCKVNWRKIEDDLVFNFDKLRFQDDWLRVVGGGEILFKQASTWPEVDMHLGFKLTDLAKARLYYPVGFMSDDVTSWLDKAFVRSKMFTGEMVLRGPLEKFPFDHDEGIFSVDTDLRDLSLQYDPAWPRINQLTGKMVFTKRALKVIARHAKIMGEPTQVITATIPDLELPVLYVEGIMENVASNKSLKFIHDSPLQKTIGAKLNNIGLSGKMDLDLKLTMPLGDKPTKLKTQVDGAIRLNNNVLHLYRAHWNIEKLTGALYFDTRNFTSHKITGKLFSQPLKFTINSLPIKGNNMLTNIAIYSSINTNNISRQLSSYAQGNITYRALLTFLSNSADSTLQVTSDLQGVELKLPPPYGKQPFEKRHLDFQYRLSDETNAYLDLNYNNQIYANLALGRDNTKNLIVTGGSVNIGKQPQEKKYNSKLTITGELPTLDWKVWKSFLAKWHNDFHAQVTAKVEQVNLKIKNLYLWQQKLSNVILNLRPRKDGCTVTVFTTDIDGKIYFPEDEKGTIKGEFQKLHLYPEQTTFETRSFPSLDLKIAEFQYGKKKVNDVKLITSPLAAGVKIDKFACSGSAFTLDGSGKWQITPKGQYTNFSGTLNTDNCGDLLRNWALTDKMYGGRGKLNFDLSWAGAPSQLGLDTARGNFNFDVTHGNITHLSSQTETKLVLNRVLNIFSLKSLAHNIFLNWRNLIRKGFIFDNLKGSCVLENGHIEFKKFSLESSELYIKSYGVLGIKDRDYNLMLSVTPSISVVAPATLLGGPIAALAGFLVDDILAKAAKSQTRYSYHVTGSWDKPIITKV